MTNNLGCSSYRGCSQSVMYSLFTSATFRQPEAMMVMRWIFCSSWTNKPSRAIWVPAKLIGVIEAEQTEEQKTTRNDRLIAVAADSRNHSHVRFLGDLNSNLLHEIERFFISYVLQFHRPLHRGCA